MRHITLMMMVRSISVLVGGPLDADVCIYDDVMNKGGASENENEDSNPMHAWSFNHGSRLYVNGTASTIETGYCLNPPAIVCHCYESSDEEIWTITAISTCKVMDGCRLHHSIEGHVWMMSFPNRVAAAFSVVVPTACTYRPLSCTRTMRSVGAHHYYTR